MAIHHAATARIRVKTEQRCVGGAERGRNLPDQREAIAGSDRDGATISRQNTAWTY
jgi:hypothetical protein